MNGMENYLKDVSEQQCSQEDDPENYAAQDVGLLAYYQSFHGSPCGRHYQNMLPSDEVKPPYWFNEIFS